MELEILVGPVVGKGYAQEPTLLLLVAELFTASLRANTVSLPTRREMLIDEFELSDEDREKLKLLNCPVPDNEARRIAVLQQTGLLDSSPKEQSFDSFTHLTALMFNVRSHHASVAFVYSN
jgi:hypothetical protein